MKIGRTVLFVSILSGCVGPFALAAPGKGATLVEELRQYYKPIKAEVVLAGNARPTLLSVRQPGLLRVAAADAPFLERCPSIYRAGEIRHSSDFFCSHLASEPEKTLKVKERVYVTDIVVNTKADNVRVYLATCNFCDPGEQLTTFRSLIVFEFAKGSLAGAKAETVVHSIDQLFGADSPAATKPPLAPGEQAAAVKSKPASGEPAAEKPAGKEAPAAGESTAASTAPEKPAETTPTAAVKPNPANPVTTTSARARTEPVSTVLREGETPEQVEQVLGKPQKNYDLGTKKIYVYPDIKVTFVDGKLTTIE